MLDAWLANQDRHDENWAVLRPTTGGGERSCLCPIYDNANSLGFNVPDGKRTRQIDEGRVEDWARNGKAWRYEFDPDQKPKSLVSVTRDALELASSEAREHWLGMLGAVTKEHEQIVIGRTPEMSDPARTFALQLLEINRRRVLDEC